LIPRKKVIQSTQTAKIGSAILTYPTAKISTYENLYS